MATSGVFYSVAQFFYDPSTFAQERKLGPKSELLVKISSISLRVFTLGISYLIAWSYLKGRAKPISDTVESVREASVKIEEASKGKLPASPENEQVEKFKAAYIHLKKTLGESERKHAITTLDRIQRTTNAIEAAATLTTLKEGTKTDLTLKTTNLQQELSLLSDAVKDNLDFFKREKTDGHPSRNSSIEYAKTKIDDSKSKLSRLNLESATAKEIDDEKREIAWQENVIKQLNQDLSFMDSDISCLEECLLLLEGALEELKAFSDTIKKPGALF